MNPSPTNHPSPIELRDHALWATKVLRPSRAGAMRRDDARNLLRRALTFQVAKRGLHVYAWSVQPSRIHLLLQIPIEYALTPVLADLFTHYTRRFNARYGKKGPVFRSKFLRQVIAGPLAITEAIRRVHALPVNCGIALDPGDEPWSSESCYEIGGSSDGVVTLYQPSSVRRSPLFLDAGL